MTTSTELSSGAAALGITLDADQLAQFSRYAALLEEWNSKIDLTSVPPGEYIRRHFLDSLSVLSALPSRHDLRLLDLGSGAGFPGIPLKIALPSLRLTLLDATKKRVEFLARVARELSLQGTDAVHGRAEEIGCGEATREVFDVVTARAVARLNVLCEWALPLTAVGGVFVAQKGAGIDEEVREAEYALTILGGAIKETRKIPAPGDEARSIVIIEKISPTPKEYPRKPGRAEKKPLQRPER